MTETLIDAARTFNVALFTFAALALAVRGNDDWRHLGAGLRLIIGAQVALLATLAYGSAEALAQDAPTGARTLLFTGACLVLLAGLWLARSQAPARTSVARVRDRAAEVAEVLEHAEHLEPCADPNCMWMRERMSAALRP